MVYRKAIVLSDIRGTLRTFALSGALGLCMSCTTETPAQGEKNGGAPVQESFETKQAARSNMAPEPVMFQISKDSPAWRMFEVEAGKKSDCPFSIVNSTFPDDPKTGRQLDCDLQRSVEAFAVNLTVKPIGFNIHTTLGETCSRQPCLYTVQDSRYRALYYDPIMRQALASPKFYFRQMIDGEQQPITLIVHGLSSPLNATCYIVVDSTFNGQLDDKARSDCEKLATGKE